MSKLYDTESSLLNENLNASIRIAKQKKEIAQLKEELETTKKLLDEAASMFQEIYDGSSDKIDRSLAKEFLAKLSEEV